MPQLTQKEQLYLQDAQKHEELCIAKFNHYSQSVSCQQLKQVLQWVGQQETTHLQSVQQMLQGQIPQTGSSQGSQQGGQVTGQQGTQTQGQSGSGQSPSINQILSQIQSSVSQQSSNQQMQAGTASQTQFTGQGQLSDQQICNDIITTEKAVNDFYGHCITETSNQQLRQVLNHIQKEEQDHAFAVYKYMEQKGWYQAQ
ncbi:MAG: spore coat protein [Bacillota bacterium]